MKVINLLLFILFLSGCASNTSVMYKDIDESQNKIFNSSNYKEIIKALKPIEITPRNAIVHNPDSIDNSVIYNYAYSLNSSDNIINFEEYKSYFKLFAFSNMEESIYITSHRIHEFLPNPFGERNHEIVFPKIVILDKEGNIVKPKTTQIKKDGHTITFKISGFPEQNAVYYLILASENFKKIPTVVLTNSGLYKFSRGVTIKYKVVPFGGSIHLYKEYE